MEAYCFNHPPLNPLPSREGLKEEVFRKGRRNKIFSKKSLKNDETG